MEENSKLEEISKIWDMPEFAVCKEELISLRYKWAILYSEKFVLESNINKLEKENNELNKEIAILKQSLEIERKKVGFKIGGYSYKKR